MEDVDAIVNTYNDRVNPTSIFRIQNIIDIIHYFSACNKWDNNTNYYFIFCGLSFLFLIDCSWIKCWFFSVISSDCCLFGALVYYSLYWISMYVKSNHFFYVLSMFGLAIHVFVLIKALFIRKFIKDTFLKASNPCKAILVCFWIGKVDLLFKRKNKEYMQ